MQIKYLATLVTSISGSPTRCTRRCSAISLNDFAMSICITAQTRWKGSFREGIQFANGAPYFLVSKVFCSESLPISHYRFGGHWADNHSYFHDRVVGTLPKRLVKSELRTLQIASKTLVSSNAFHRHRKNNCPSVHRWFYQGTL